MDKFSRYFFGFLFFICSALSIILGIEYPFWIVPGLGLWYVLGSGMPGGGDILVFNNNSKTLTSSSNPSSKAPSLYASVHQHNDHSLPKKVYEIAASTGITEPVAAFNYPINLSFDVKDMYNFSSNKKNSVVMGSSANAITIVFEVHSVGWFGRVTLEGYGYTVLPLHGHTGEIEVFR